MRRLDWQLVRPDGEGELNESLQTMQMIRRLATKEAAGTLTDDDEAVLMGAEDSYLSTTLSHCDAVEAPLIEQDPHWENRIIDEYAASAIDMELEDYLDMRRREPDCELCPFASPYSLYPMDPCEFSAGALEEILTDPALVTRIAEPMKPRAMHSLADDIETAHRTETWRDIPEIDVEDYLTKAVLFLRFWADQGFGLLPTDIDEIVESAASFPANDGDEDPPVFH